MGDNKISGKFDDKFFRDVIDPMKEFLKGQGAALNEQWDVQLAEGSAAKTLNDLAGHNEVAAFLKEADKLEGYLQPVIARENGKKIPGASEALELANETFDGMANAAERMAETIKNISEQAAQAKKAGAAANSEVELSFMPQTDAPKTPTGKKDPQALQQQLEPIRQELAMGGTLGGNLKNLEEALDVLNSQGTSKGGEAQEIPTRQKWNLGRDGNGQGIQR